MKTWSRLGVRRHAITPDRTALFKEFNNPLSYMDADALRHLRNKCIGIALLYTLAGAALIAVLIWSSDGQAGASGSSSRFGGGLMGGGILIFALFAYGIFRLCTIRRSMISKRRDVIAMRDIADRAARKPQN